MDSWYQIANVVLIQPLVIPNRDLTSTNTKLEPRLEQGASFQNGSPNIRSSRNNMHLENMRPFKVLGR